MALLRRAFRQPGSYRQKETRFRGKESKIRRQHADDLAGVTTDGKTPERRKVAAAFVVIGYRRAVILDSGFWISVEDRDQSIGLRKRERTEQNRIDHREDGEVRPETDRDRSQRGQ